jgi:hypothetical protein
MSPPSDRWKIRFFLLLFCSLVVVGWLSVHRLDDSATLSGLREHSRRSDHALNVLAASFPEIVTNRGTLTRQSLAAALRQHTAASRVTEGPSSVEIDQLRFTFATDGSLSKVERTDDYGTRESDIPTNRPSIQ